MEAREFTITRRNGDVYTVIVDACDYDRVMAAGPWYISPPNKKRRTAYARRSSTSTRAGEYLHRFIIGAPAGAEADHVSGNGLDCRRGNLRVCTRSENERNKGVRSDNTSGFKGVHLDRRLGRWQAQITLFGRTRSIGMFATPEAAHEAYKAAAAQLHGEFARAA
ncbi:MAG: hypothetical protein RLZZ450_6579 [Pseudomonadota bacterium]|jgi:hypothetical protein